MVTVKLNVQKGKQWKEFENGYIKGFAFKHEELLRDESFYLALYNALKKDVLNEFLIELNGFFSIVINYGNKLFLISDKLRTYPLFYHVKDDVIITDDPEYLFKEVNCELDLINCYELLTLGYLSCAPSTLVKDVFYVVSGSYSVINLIDKRAKISSYHNYIQRKVNLKKEELFERANKALESAFLRMLKVIDNRPILIPLSGGYDSRLIACLCKKYAVEDVTCYTYGRHDSHEVSTSKKVAEALGFKWHYIEYNKEVWYNFINSFSFEDFCRFSGNLTGNPLFQDLPALTNLKNEGLINKYAVALPGYYGDLIGGSKIPVDFGKFKKARDKRRSLKNLIFSVFYCLNEVDRERKSQLFTKMDELFVENNIDSLTDIFDNYDPLWINKSRYGNFILNATRMFEFIGIDWYVLLADDEYQKIWYEVPWEQKSNSALYEEFMFSMYFKSYNVDFRKPIIPVTLRAKIIGGFLNSFPDVIHDNIINIWDYLKRNLRKEIDTSHDINDFITASSLLFDPKYATDYDGVTKINKDEINAIVAFYYLNLINKSISKTKYTLSLNLGVNFTSI
ncbi:MAG: asparagine synthase-related protein [Bacteroidales bacterium]|jgi:asparagine synthase (glutamine-hydrolysing)